ncbi:ariadne-2 [Sarotherodon galilaeus]
MVKSGSLFALVTVVLVAVAVSGSDARRASRRRPCCVQVTSRNMSAEVVGETYREQAAGSPCVKAVIFHTNDGPLCADPIAQWVMDLAANMTKMLKHHSL